MACLESSKKLALADDFESWYSGWKWTWDNAKEAKLTSDSAAPATKGNTQQPVASSKTQEHQLPTSELTENQKRLIALMGKNHSPSSSISSISFLSDSSSSHTSPLSSLEPLKVLFTTEYLEARPSSKGGFGVFATKDIDMGVIALQESPLLMSNSIELFYVFDNLSTEDQKRFKSLHGWRGINTNRITSIYMTNRFELGATAGVFYKASRFNHACHPNATLTYAWREEDQKMVFSTLQPIKEGEEMTISYGNVAMLYHNYGFYCDCPKCPASEYPSEHTRTLHGFNQW